MVYDSTVFYMKQQDSPPTTPPPNPTTIPTSWNFFYNSKVTTWKKYVQCLFSWQIICRISTQSETRYQIKLNQNKQDPTLFWEPESRFHYLSFKVLPSFFFFDFWNKKGLFHMFFTEVCKPVLLCKGIQSLWLLTDS